MRKRFWGIMLTAAISASMLIVSCMTASAMRFTEDEKGVKLWEFGMNQDGSSISGDITFNRAGTENSGEYYYLKDGDSNSVIVKPEDMSDYLTLRVLNSQTVESQGKEALFLFHDSHGRYKYSSTLRYTPPVAGTIEISAVNNGVKIEELNEKDEAINTVECNNGEVGRMHFDAGDVAQISTDKYGGVKYVKFTPDAAAEVTVNIEEAAGYIPADGLLTEVTDNGEYGSKVAWSQVVTDDSKLVTMLIKIENPIEDMVPGVQLQDETISPKSSVENFADGVSYFIYQFYGYDDSAFEGAEVVYGDITESIPSV